MVSQIAQMDQMNSHAQVNLDKALINFTAET